MSLAKKNITKKNNILSFTFNFIKEEIVFVIATLVAIISAFFVPPSIEYFSYIDWDTLFILFSLMAVVQGLKKEGLFDYFSRVLSKKAKTKKGISFILVFLCFFMSMFITNDVALITFVPFTIQIFAEKRANLLIYVIVLETIAANLGSMLLPIGNPQNLFLFGTMDCSILDFMLFLLPYVILSAIILTLLLLFIPAKPLNETNNNESEKCDFHLKGNILYGILFFTCILSVTKLLPKYILIIIVGVVVFIKDKSIFKKIDYMLLLTFMAFFVFTGNIGNINEIKTFLIDNIKGKELFSGIIFSQVISNVPAALMLQPFALNIEKLLIGVNIGGLGTIIASLASLISFKIYNTSITKPKSSLYLLIFSLLNILFLGLLILLAIILD